MKLDSETKTAELSHKILELSLRVSRASPPMKPFIRFSKCAREKTPGGVSYSRLLWDFDDLVQKRLLDLLCEMASPETIVQLCVEQWERNLERLYEGQKRALERARHSDHEYTFHSSDGVEFIVERVRPRGRLLYIGCGTGRECFLLAKKGLRVVGIDTAAPLVEVAKGWAVHLALLAEFVCMDVMGLGFESGHFDGFLLEFYGSWPSWGQTLALQKELARVLAPDGLGFVTSMRKRYASYWFRMGSCYPLPMTRWLISHAHADFLFSEADSCEERLVYGLYNRAHTVQSLSSELSHTFEVAECLYQKDPRYVMAVVRRKNGIETHEAVVQSDVSMEKRVSPSRLLEIEDTLGRVELVCDQLEAHAAEVTACFREHGESRINDCLEAVSASSDMSGFMDLLQDILGPE